MILIPMLLFTYFITLDYKEEKVNFEEEKNNALEEVSEELQEQRLPSREQPIITLSYKGNELTMSEYDYVVGVVACEVPASFNYEALKAMAVAARTFYYYKKTNQTGYIATTSDQCYNTIQDMEEKWGENFQKYYGIISEAVNDTSGEYLTYDGNIIESFYFSMSNGMTEDVQNVFSETRDYLVSVDSSWDKNLDTYSNTTTFTVSEFLTNLGLDGENVTIGETSKSQSGRINTIVINDIQFRGVEVRRLLGIRSTDFDIEVDSETVTLTTRGYGHGVGMSQYGANEMAKLGYNYQEILKHYYSGVDISKSQV